MAWSCLPHGGKTETQRSGKGETSRLFGGQWTQAVMRQAGVSAATIKILRRKGKITDLREEVVGVFCCVLVVVLIQQKSRTKK